MTTSTKLRDLLLAFVVCLIPLAGSATIGTVAGDTYISSTSPTLNFGNQGTLNVSSGTSALIQLDLSALPAGLTASNIRKATLTVFVNKVFTAGGLDFAAVTSSWTESTVTFNNQPTAAAPFATNVPVSASGTYITIDITNLVQQWVTGTSLNSGIMVKPAAAQPNTTVNLDSKESTSTSHAAFIDVTLQ